MALNPQNNRSVGSPACRSHTVNLTRSSPSEFFKSTAWCQRRSIVVGAHGRSQMTRALLGSTSEIVARHAPCSILVVRNKHESNSKEDPTPHLTIASDSSDVDAEITAQVSVLGLPKGTNLELVSVIEHPYLLEPAFEFDAQIMQETKLAMDRLAKQLESTSVNIEKHVFKKCIWGLHT